MGATNQREEKGMKDKKRLFEAVAKGYSYATAIDRWSAALCIDLKLGEYRIGNNVMYKPVSSVESNQNRVRSIESIDSLRY